MSRSPLEVKEPDLGPLHRALAECGIAAEQIDQVAKQLTRPPLSIGRTTSDDRAADATIQLSGGRHRKVKNIEHPFDGDAAARMLRLNEGKPDPDAKWGTLSRAERKRAKRLWDWFGKPHGLSVTPTGRPPAIDPALVIFLTRVLCEATGGLRFPFSRGPMWRALIEALPLAQSFLAYRFGMPATGRTGTTRRDLRVSSHLEGIAEVIRATRSTTFNNLCKMLELVPSSDDVAAKPSEFRVVIAYARRSRSQNRQPPPSS
jgi:hypothetical protein